jgi:hypothetical protein
MSMEGFDFKKACEELSDALKRENGGRLDDHESFDSMERHSSTLKLWLALREYLTMEC